MGSGMCIRDSAVDYDREAAAALKAAGQRVELDNRNEKSNRKIREHSNNKIPAIFVLGRNEAEEGKVTIRRLGRKQQQTVSLTEAVQQLREEALARTAPKVDVAA